MHPARIAGLLQPFLSPISNPCYSESGQRPGEEPAVLSPEQLHHISTYIDILLRWNERINLTAIRNPEDIVTRHFGESLFAARHLFSLSAHGGTLAPSGPVERSSTGSYQGTASSRAEPSAAENGALAPATLADARRMSSAARVADIGSGAGFPGLPLKLWAPHISLTLIESNHKRVAFLREVARALTLTDINILPARAQDVAKQPTQPPRRLFDLVTLRAVERFGAILPTAARLLAPGARLALLIGASQQHRAQSTIPTLTWQDPVPVPLSRSRILLVAQHSDEPIK